MEIGLQELRDRINEDVAECVALEEFYGIVGSLPLAECVDAVVFMPCDDEQPMYDNSGIEALRDKIKGRALERELHSYVYHYAPDTTLTIKDPVLNTDTNYTEWMW